MIPYDKNLTWPRRNPGLVEQIAPTAVLLEKKPELDEILRPQAGVHLAHAVVEGA